MEKKIPANLITGFLGSGKTTAIVHLLRQKPENETWAVLVNEFGEVGIDGALLQGSSARNDVFVREVPGGCMCCVAGLPMQIGLNMLIARSKPDRLLIEPTGLGHPQEIINTLQGEYYREILSLEASICLVDPRNLEDTRYLENDNFRDQIHLADVLVANKTDLSSETDRRRFEQFADQLPLPKPETAWVKQGALSVEWLDLPRRDRVAVNPNAHHAHHKGSDQLQTTEAMGLKLAEGQLFLRKENTGQHHFSCGWLFSDSTSFSFDRLFSLIHAQTAQRLKAVAKTDRGVKGFNMQDGIVSVIEIKETSDSRLEIISSSPMDWDDFETRLQETIIFQPAA
ncbi:GTP-binding protein [Endozoicomonas sp. GU-1]|uniref:CobW family GTP-binding protein n=1 Tax=Endozoicomonas sp. GU-1 TaxID=3009078 RepID=UPI0022B52D90|nr:GTP-binding protein [Endozoicomonas sp. GU-1]WBA80500.1 GTP-binding protein [Endozoicomonas sp. GU-1]WBA88065.1 GTP-binding protein [Endozoicomonas sp. GU-1]